MRQALHAVGVTILGLAIMVVALSSAAAMLNGLFDRPPEYRADLTVPPSYIICQQDAGGNCWVRGH